MGFGQLRAARHFRDTASRSGGWIQHTAKTVIHVPRLARPRPTLRGGHLLRLVVDVHVPHRNELPRIFQALRIRPPHHKHTAAGLLGGEVDQDAQLRIGIGLTTAQKSKREEKQAAHGDHRVSAMARLSISLKSVEPSRSSAVLTMTRSKEGITVMD